MVPGQKKTRTVSSDVPEPGPGDYYLDDEGLMVFTRQYHLKRGYCCKSACRHCPWDYKKKKV